MSKYGLFLHVSEEGVVSPILSHVCGQDGASKWVVGNKQRVFPKREWGSLQEAIDFSLEMFGDD